MASTNGTLIPSQALNATASSFTPTESAPRNEGLAKTKSKTRNKKKESNVATTEPANTKEAQPKPIEQRELPTKKKRNRNRRKSISQNQTKADGSESAAGSNVASHKSTSETKSARSGTRKPQAANPRNRNTMKHPWRKEIPEGAMDPITLDPLVSLAYPPFALCAQAPYTPVSVWPVKEQVVPSHVLSKRDRELQILQQQWVGVSLQETRTETTEAPTPRHYNLYDGRALAYYLVSQLQFIDPLNRRDLTRDELLSLDQYLARHGFDKKFKVVEAYDAKGVTVSTAGAAGNTAAGRATILQQEAQVLLNSLFAGPNSVLQQQYQSQQQQYQSQQQEQQNNSLRPARQQQNNSLRPTRQREYEDDGIYGEEGLVIIDDDVNPGLRGIGYQQASSRDDNQSLWSASHITNQYNGSATVTDDNFPALAAPPASFPIAQKPIKTTAPPSKTLLCISKVVTKTTAKELERQRAAREAFVRRSQMSNLSFSGDGSITTQSSLQHVGSGLLLPPSAAAVVAPTEGQLLRNQAFAAAMGVTPATLRQQSHLTSWARPTTTTLELDEFGNELNAANYPDSLIVKARERMELTVKMEKRWIKFLQDDKAASLPLPKMDKSTRAFVHEYAEFWKLHTESFDPEPKRYIHCVKLRDTSVPRPLLSDAAHKWRGPRMVPRVEQEHSIRQTAGQTPREFPPPPDRAPLPLQPRTLPVGFVAPPGAMFDMEIATVDQVSNSRSNELFSGRERPKLQLAARTLPREGNTEEEPKYSIVEERERQKEVREERARQEQAMEDKKRRVLEAAFASDSEGEELSLASHDSDEWDDVPDQLAEYTGSDDD